MEPLPLPSPAMRALVGPTDPAAFDNPTGDDLFGALVPAECYDRVLDFGCGCGRNARMLIQQRRRPSAYLGVDLHAGMVDWCRANLTPAAPQFEFRHHDVFNAGFNPGGATGLMALPTDEQFGLFIAHSVFTHILPEAAPHYLAELRRTLAPGGRAVTSWFFFDKRYFPMMQEFQNALFINTTDPTNAVIYDRAWFHGALADADLGIVTATPPQVRGHQWVVVLAARSETDGRHLPEADDAPFGVVRAAAGIERPDLIRS